MNPLGIIKTATELVVSIGTGAVVGNAIKASTPANLKTLQKVSIGIGGFVLSNMIGDMAAKYAVKTIDDSVEELKKAKDVLSNNVQEEN